MRLQSATPLTLTKLAVIGSALMFAGSLASYLPFASHPRACTFTEIFRNGGVGFSCVLLPFLAGTFLAWWANSSLDKGIRNDVWTEEQLEPARRFSQARVFPILQGVATFCFFAFTVVWLARHRHFTFAYGFVYALSPITIMQRHLRKPLTPGARIAWAEIKPIHSTHWGQPVA